MSLMALYTAEQYMDMDLDDQRTELVRGVIQVVRDHVDTAHGITAVRIAFAIQAYLETYPIGFAAAETGCVTERDPDTVRGPDVSYVSRERAQADIRGLVAGAPDIAIEILSPSNRPREMAKKVAEYLNAGACLVWVVDPRQKTVTVHAPDARSYVVREGEFLDAGEVLPGFRVAITKFFAWPP